jgi:single-strand DNA-binding protein
MTIARATILGRLTRDPETKFLANDTQVTSFTVAVDARKKDDPASFFDVTAFGKTAEIIAKYWTKGKPIVVDGEMRQERWEDKATGAKRSAIKVVADRVSFVPRDSSQSSDGPAPDSTGGFAPLSAVAPATGSDEEPPF